jgi:hypothetical protein
MQEKYYYAFSFSSRCHSPSPVGELIRTNLLVEDRPSLADVIKEIPSCLKTLGSKPTVAFLREAGYRNESGTELSANCIACIPHRSMFPSTEKIIQFAFILKWDNEKIVQDGSLFYVNDTKIDLSYPRDLQVTIIDIKELINSSA